MYLNKKNLIILLALSSVLLLIAFLKHDYVYYQFLRWIIFGSAIYGISFVYKKRIKLKTSIHAIAIICFLLITIIYNPIEPFFLNRQAWEIINIITIFVFTLSIFYFIKIRHIYTKIISKKLNIVLIFIAILVISALVFIRKESNKCLEVYTFYESGYEGKANQLLLYGDTYSLWCYKDIFDESDFCSYDDLYKLANECYCMSIEEGEFKKNVHNFDIDFNFNNNYCKERLLY